MSAKADSQGGNVADSEDKHAIILHILAQARPFPAKRSANVKSCQSLK
jgi:hypothetical protein